MTRARNCFKYCLLAALGLFGYSQAFAKDSNRVEEGPEMQVNFESQAKKFIVGIELRTNNQEASSTIPAHWQRFYQENIQAKIPNKKNGNVYALYTDYEGDFTKPYSCILGCEVTSLAVVPDGFVGKAVPESRYAVYTTRGGFPKGLIEAWQAIWKSNLKRSYTTDFEFYLSDFNPQEKPEVKVYIALEN